MARYIFIDNNSGFIFGDSADIDGKAIEGTPIDIAQAVDASFGIDRRRYTESSNPRDTRAGYHVYSVPESLPIITNGQDQALIDKVVRSGTYVCFVATTQDY